ncbi:hypothetical protein LIA77_10359 [Sarocladium implicatum]|nr:hypothetical protein LIA77_10359 [Sarocladium implicatum]
MSHNIHKLATVCGHTWQECDTWKKTPLRKLFRSAPPPPPKADDRPVGIEVRLGWCPACLHHYRTVRHRRVIPLNSRRIILNYWSYKASLPGQPVPLPATRIFPTLFDSHAIDNLPPWRERWPESPEERCMFLTAWALSPAWVRMEGKDWPAAKTVTEVVELLYCARLQTMHQATERDEEDLDDWVNVCAKVREREPERDPESEAIDWNIRSATQAYRKAWPGTIHRPADDEEAADAYTTDEESSEDDESDDDSQATRRGHSLDFVPIEGWNQ